MRNMKRSTNSTEYHFVRMAIGNIRKINIKIFGFHEWRHGQYPVRKHGADALTVRSASCPGGAIQPCIIDQVIASEQYGTEKESAIDTRLQEWEAVGIALHQSRQVPWAMVTSATDPNHEVRAQKIHEGTCKGSSEYLCGMLPANGETDEGQEAYEDIILQLSAVESGDRGDAVKVKDMVQEI